MFIKLLCINTVRLEKGYDNEYFIIKEGNIVGALIDRYGVHFEFD